ERGHETREERILPVLSPAADDVAGPVFEALHHVRDVARIVLQVAVEGGDQTAIRVGKPRRKRRGLAEVAPEPDQLQVRVEREQTFQELETPVLAAIVHEDQLVRAAPRAERLRQLAVQLFEAGRLVPDGNDDGEVHHLVDRIQYTVIGAAGAGLSSTE